MPDQNGNPLPGEAGYEEWAKTHSGGFIQGLGRHFGIDTNTATGSSGTSPGPSTDAYGNPNPGTPGYDEWAKLHSGGLAQGLFGHFGVDTNTATAGGAGPGDSAAPSPVPAPAGAPEPQGYLEDLWKTYGGAFFGPTNQGNDLPGLRDKLGKPGQAEQFYEDAKDPSSDPYYQRQLKMGTDSMNQQMAARGHGTGAAGGGVLGNFESGLFANQYAQRGALAKTAQDEGQARAGLLGQLDNAADTTDTARLTGAFGTAGQAQKLNLDGVNSYLDRVTGLDTASANLVKDAFAKGGDISSEAGRSAIEAQVQAAIAKAGGTQAQQDTAMKALAAIWAAI